ncbi:hypothetical protein KDAU_64400 [Dictyobacter aurantiacus]|uniref:Carrier domain-containing protein n=2 Tax=Dictyobacter aurantiacus TaxID=1936993 RepID=A0A401ZQG6_9CHLR|nr:hypothetical protein KDAU_64400 [Dictyobacter aurantiacus]
MYRTGDIVRYQADGMLEFLGRRDTQIKVRGLRTELSEIETLISKYVAVAEVVVLPHANKYGETSIIAWYMVSNEKFGDIRETLFQYLEGYLSASLLASIHLVQMEALPRLASGKIDHQALPVQIADATAYVAPKPGTEQIIADIWQQVLHNDHISATNNFFRIGGHSLLAMQAIVRIREQFNVELPLRVIYDKPRLTDLAQYIDVILSQTTKELSEIKSEEYVTPPPLSFGQERLWFLDHLDEKNIAYHMPLGIRLQGALDLVALEHSLTELVARHAILRTTLRMQDGQPVQFISPQQPVSLRIQDLTTIVDALREEHVHAFLTQEIEQPFNLAQGPLLRHLLLRLSPQEHILMFTWHHSISDGWSQEVFLRELSALYTAFHAGLPSPLSPVKLHYADYAVWQRQQTTEFAQQLTYWKEQLAGAPALLDLPTDFPRPGQQTFVGTRYPFTISTDQVQKVRTLSHREHVTTYMILLAVYQVLLARYSGQMDLVVGTPIAGRTRVELEEMLGFLVNTLALRVSLAANPSFAHLLQQVREVALQAYAHQDVPFEQVVQALQPERTLSHSPIFQVMFSLQNTPALTLSFPALTCEIQPLVSRVAQFDLTMDLVEIEGRIEGEIEYNTDLFREETIARLVTHYLHLLAQLVDDPTQAVFRVSLLTAQERQLQLVTWNQTAAPFPQDRCLHELFEEQVQKSPQAPAVLFEDTQLSYEELNARANQLAHVLQGYGVTPDTLVGLCVERSLEMVVGMLGILKAGGAYVPLDPDYPAERLKYMLTNTGVNVLLTQAHLQDRLPMHQARVLCLDADWSQIAQAPSTNLSTSGVHPAHLAYVIYTSGSTGLPKGVMVQHSGLCNRLQWMQDTYHLTSKDRVLQKTPFNFDVSVWELYWPLLYGAVLVIGRPNGHRDPGYLHDTIVAQQITIIHFVPSMLQVFLEEVSSGRYSALRLVICSGEALGYDLQTRFFAKFPDIELHNLYGPTEASIDVTYWPCEREEVRQTVPIGRPIANMHTYILDAHLQPVPIGVQGNLYLSGIGLARGYFQRPETTAEKFIPHPFSSIPGERLYRTGDLARYTSDGLIEYLGRDDHQVKVRGFRIELGEIEAILSQHPNVHECVVLAREDTPGEKRLVAYVVLLPECIKPNPDLRSYLSSKLPAYMLPALFVILPLFPLTSNGKLDRNALPSPDPSCSQNEANFVEPLSQTEKQLAAIWSQVLHLNKVSIHDNFFQIGGDSILSILIVAKAREQGIHLTPTHIFQYQTIAELASIAGTTAFIQPDQDEIRGDVPLTPIQRWFFEQQFVEMHHWNQANLFEIRGPLDNQVLQQALLHIAKHHDALRMVYRYDGQKWKQMISPIPSHVPLEQIDLTHISADQQLVAIEAEATRIQSSIDLTSGLLMRCALFTLGVHRPQQLLIVVHHLVIDIVSWHILLEDLTKVCLALQNNQPAQLPLKTTSFQQWSRALQTYANNNQVRNELAYWVQELQQPVTPLPVDQNIGENLIGSTMAVVRTLTSEETQTLLQIVPKVCSTHINDVLLAVLIDAYARWTGKQEMLVDLEGHGREEVISGVDLTRTVGWFTTITPIRLKRSMSGDLIDTVQAVKTQLRHVSHGGIHYGLLRYLTSDATIAAQLTQIPPAEISFNYMGRDFHVASHENLFTLSHYSPGKSQSDKAHSPYLLDISVTIEEEQFRIFWNYSTNRYHNLTIEQLADNYMFVLRELLRRCEVQHTQTLLRFALPGFDVDQNLLDSLLSHLDESEGDK